MPITEAQKRATRKWNEANLDRINLVVPKGDKEKIKEVAEMCGESVNTFIKKAIASRMNESLSS